MGFKEEMVAISDKKSKISNTIQSIKQEIRRVAEAGLYNAFDVYRLETENKYHWNIPETEVSVDYGKIQPVTQQDAIIIKEFMDMGFNVTFTSVDLNPYPEVGQEGYSAAFFMNVSWE